MSSLGFGNILIKDLLTGELIKINITECLSTEDVFNKIKFELYSFYQSNSITVDEICVRTQTGEVVNNVTNNIIRKYMYGLNEPMLTANPINYVPPKIESKINYTSEPISLIPVLLM